jgi:hypothetical protein
MDPGPLDIRGVPAKSFSGYDFVWENEKILLAIYITNEIRYRPQTALPVYCSLTAELTTLTRTLTLKQVFCLG